MLLTFVERAVKMIDVMVKSLRNWRLWLGIKNGHGGLTRNCYRFPLVQVLVAEAIISFCGIGSKPLEIFSTGVFFVKG